MTRSRRGDGRPTGRGLLVLLSILLVSLLGCSDHEEEASRLQVSPERLDFGLEGEHLGVQVRTTHGTIPWQASADQPWISISPGDGTAGPDPSSIEIGVSRAGLAPGLHAGTVTVASEAGTVEVPVTVRVPGPVLEVSPLELSLGTEVREAELKVMNSGTESLDWKSENPAEWIEVDPARGHLDPGGAAVLRVRVQRVGLPSGVHEAVVGFRSEGGDVDVTVSCEVPPPVLSVEPTELDFGETDTEQSFQIRNLGGGILTWTLRWEAPWVSASPAGGEVVESQTVSIEVDRADLEPGAHETSLLVESDGGSAGIHLLASVPSWTPYFLQPDGTLSTEPAGAGALYQKRFSEGGSDWVAPGAGAGIHGTRYLLSLYAASYEPTEVKVSVILEADGTEIPLVETSFLVESSSLSLYEALLTGPDPTTLPGAGDVVVRITTEGTLWVGMGDPAAYGSSVRLPAS